jgi:hypothetical protein
MIRFCKIAMGLVFEIIRSYQKIHLKINMAVFCFQKFKVLWNCKSNKDAQIEHVQFNDNFSRTKEEIKKIQSKHVLMFMSLLSSNKYKLYIYLIFAVRLISLASS